MPAGRDKTILIIDESGFTRVCYAILEFEGYGVETMADSSDLAVRLNNNEFGLIITSYPYGAFLFEDIKKRDIPTIILSDHINSDLISILENFDNSYCMIKPLDYQKFMSLVKKVMRGDLSTQGGYAIV
ncbi:MAG TPA: DNA-binding response regulator [Nitrospirae bacterium]|nr:DNA-binding response regulator [Nitrospirota bacterium]